MNKHIILSHGNGGREMQEFLGSFLGDFYRGPDWQNCENDGATYPLSDGKQICFTTDSYVINPIEFPGGNIGHLAFSGTVNDLVVMGADPIGISLSLVLEEGFDRKTLSKTLKSINDLSHQYKIPVVTGDTKVMEKGAIDQMVINTSGVGLISHVLNDSIENGDKIFISGGIGEHGVALLSKRFDFQTEIKTDSKPLIEEMKSIRDLIKCAKDPTRGGLASSLNEMANTYGAEFEIDESKIPIKKNVKSACDLLGIEVLELANEGTVMGIVSSENAAKVVDKLKKFNLMAGIIGEIKNEKLKMKNAGAIPCGCPKMNGLNAKNEKNEGMKGNKEQGGDREERKAKREGRVYLKTGFGTRVLGMPSGQIVPRIC